MSNFIPCIIKGEIHDIPSWLVAKNPSRFVRADQRASTALFLHIQSNDSADLDEDFPTQVAHLPHQPHGGNHVASL